MQYVRKIINSDNLEPIIDLPKALKNTMVEVLVLHVEEDNNKNNINKLRPSDYRGVLKVDNVEKEIEMIRSDWERDQCI